MKNKRRKLVLFRSLIHYHKIENKNLSHIKFDRYGKFIINKSFFYLKRHFPHLLQEFEALSLYLSNKQDLSNSKT